MKKRYPIGIAALMLAIGLVLLGCSDDNSSSGPETKTYSGQDGDTTYELKITGDDYVLTITDAEGTKKTNSGTVISGSDGTIGLQPEAGETIVITTESGGIGGIAVGGGGSISVKDEDGNPAAPVAPPAEITPVVPAAPAGSITFTGIDSQYNGQYASFRSSGNTEPTGGDYLFGGSSISTGGITGVRISGGSVTIPVHLVNMSSSSTGTSNPYKGNDKNIRIYLNIKSSASFTFDDLWDEDYEKYTISSVNFTNGSASANVGGNSAPKTLTITGITPDQADQGQSNIRIGIFPPGTTPEQAMSQQTGYVAGADSENVTVSGSGSSFTVTVSLYTPSGSGWTGSGTYDIYLVLGGNAYRSQNVSFTLASTTVTATSFSVVKY